MSTITEKIKQIEHEMSITQKNKANEMHLGLLKSRLSKLRRELITPSTKGGDKSEGEGFEVKKSGDVSLGMIGFPSVGKSTLFSELTNTESLAAAYEFTTLTCIPVCFNLGVVVVVVFFFIQILLHDSPSNDFHLCSTLFLSCSTGHFVLEIVGYIYL